MLDKASAIEERVAELERKLSDPATLGNQREYARLAKAEMPTLQKNLDAVEEKLKELLTPRDPNDEKNVILEIRAGRAAP